MNPAERRFWERVFASSPRDAGVGRGPRRGAASLNVPPLPGPLLHPMEERGHLGFLLSRAGNQALNRTEPKPSDFSRKGVWSTSSLVSSNPPVGQYANYEK